MKQNIPKVIISTLFSALLILILLFRYFIPALFGVKPNFIEMLIIIILSAFIYNRFNVRKTTKSFTTFTLRGFTEAIIIVIASIVIIIGLFYLIW